jgi:UDP-N-acetylmuramoyl-tripeptide--D-alanyl-D-alanine ligase
MRAGEARELLAAAGIPARLEGEPSARFESAVVDSRKAVPGSLFAALPGERVDGHDYAAAALASGSSLLLLEAERGAALSPGLGAALRERKAAALHVPAVLPALQLLARERRRLCPRLRRVGVTGSSGKTTTKELIAGILGQGHPVAVNPGNLNSDIGLALSMFLIRPEDEYGVFEMGMNRRGEMAELAAIYEPDHALVTNIGTAHIGILGSRDAIAREKRDVFSRFTGSESAYVWEDDAYKAFLTEGLRGHASEFGPRGTPGFRGATDLGLDGWAVDWEGLGIRFPLTGRHNLLDALAAISVCRDLGMSAADIARGLESARPLFGRSEILRGEVTIVRDCYNANPESVEAAVAFCDSVTWPGRRAYVLGSMRELGNETEAAHRGVGAMAAASRADALFFLGEEARSSFEAARDAGFRGFLAHETELERLGATVKSWIGRGDLVLLKASRGVALERLVDYLVP